MNIQKISEKTWEMVKWHKRYVLAAVVLFFFVVRWYFSWSTTTTTTVTQTYSVATGSIQNTLKLIWTTKITNMQTLVFWAEGKVKAIYVKEGDKVKAGQLLAEIDKKSLSISLSQQALSIQNARINYDKLLTQYTDADKLKAQNDVNSAQSQLDIANQQLQNLISDQWNVLQINGNLAQTNIITAKSILNDVSNILESIDVIYWITPRNQPINANTNISANNVSYKNIVGIDYNDVNAKLQNIQNLLTTIQSSTTINLQSIKDLQQKETSIINALSSMVSSALNWVRSSVACTILPQSQIDQWASSLTSDNSKVISDLTSINSNINSVTNSNTNVQTKQNEINNDQAQLQMLQQTVQDMENGPKSNDRILQSNAIKQSQLSYEQISQQLDNYQIIAPFDGTIDTIWFKVGDTVSYSAGSSTNGITVSNPDAYEVNTLIDQIDIVKVMPGQPVEITFDAYPGYSITWTIASIDPTPVTSAGVVSYKAKINLQQITGKKIYDSMSANVKVIIDHKDNILVIPTIAIQTSGDNSFVWTQQGIKDISVGITDGTQTEILSWLVLDEVVLAKEYQVQSAAKSSNPFQSTKTAGTWNSWQSQSKTQSFRMLQGAGGPGN